MKKTMACAPFFRERDGMGKLADEEEKMMEQSTSRCGSEFSALCATQLKYAIEESRQELDGLTEAALSAPNGASMELITRLQHTDRFMQRLSNVQANLERLACFLGNRDDAQNESAWCDLLQQSRATFTMAHEREIFDGLLGKPALDKLSTPPREEQSDPILFDDGTPNE